MNKPKYQFSKVRNSIDFKEAFVTDNKIEMTVIIIYRYAFCPRQSSCFFIFLGSSNEEPSIVGPERNPDLAALFAAEDQPCKVT